MESLSLRSGVWSVSYTHLDVYKRQDKYSVSEARYIEGAMDAHNTFEAPEVVDEKDFTAYENTDVYKRQGYCREQIHMYTDIQTEHITFQRPCLSTTGLYLEKILH